MKRIAQAHWEGTGSEGSGTLTTQSRVLDSQTYTVPLRFENEDGTSGTNPEELIAAAHAGCFTMALGVALEGAGYTPDTMDTQAELTLSKKDGWEIERIDLNLTASVPGIEDEEFQKLAEDAKEGCPVSKVLNCEITLEYTLK